MGQALTVPFGVVPPMSKCFTLIDFTSQVSTISKEKYLVAQASNSWNFLCCAQRSCAYTIAAYNFCTLVMVDLWILIFLSEF